MQVSHVIIFIAQNREVLTAFLLSLITIIKLTAWGKAQAKALDAVVGVIEKVDAGDVKTAVAGIEKGLADAAKDALTDSVAKADPKKSPLSTGWKVFREIIRVI